MSLQAAILIALLGAALKYLNDIQLARRKDRLDRISQQLKLLYGPLYALDQAARVAWLAFRSLHRAGTSFWNAEPPPTEDDKAAWRLWMTAVFMPLNRRMVDAIISNANLLVEPQIPKCLLDLCAHVSAYEAIVKQWQASDFSRHVSVLNYPWAEVSSYVSNSYQALGAEQDQLLR